VCVLGDVLESVRHQRRVVFYWYTVSKQTCVGVFQSEAALRFETLDTRVTLTHLLHLLPVTHTADPGRR